MSETTSELKAPLQTVLATKLPWGFWNIALNLVESVVKALKGACHIIDSAFKVASLLEVPASSRRNIVFR
eukprot:4231222-Amphidinium_carterae.1